ncbi:MAG: peptidase M28 family protein, partial [Eudoraea sp.]|nr:peptidase M28 family protein [Eudoraea sp.]
MRYLGLLLIILLVGPIWSQTEDKEQLKAIYDASLTQGKSYTWLNYLSNQIGGRLTGSVQAEQAVEYTKQKLDSLG